MDFKLTENTHLSRALSLALSRPLALLLARSCWLTRPPLSRALAQVSTTKGLQHSRGRAFRISRTRQWAKSSRK
jgi:hypothetical protein